MSCGDGTSGTRPPVCRCLRALARTQTPCSMMVELVTQCRRRDLGPSPFLSARVAQQLRPLTTTIRSALILKGHLWHHMQSTRAAHQVKHLVVAALRQQRPLASTKSLCQSMRKFRSPHVTEVALQLSNLTETFTCRMAQPSAILQPLTRCRHCNRSRSLPAATIRKCGSKAALQTHEMRTGVSWCECVGGGYVFKHIVATSRVSTLIFH